METESSQVNRTDDPAALTDDPAALTDDPIEGTTDETNTSIDPFNVSNVTMLESKMSLDVEDAKKPHNHCEGSDSGVEVVESVEICLYRRNLSSNSGTSQDFEHLNVRSCDSSLISVCSNYDEAYNVLVRKNSTLLEDYGRNGDLTSDNGSESSSISGSQSRSSNKRATIGCNNTKKIDLKTRASSTKERSRSKPPTTPNDTVRLKSVDRLQGRPTSLMKPLIKRESKTNLDSSCLSKRDAKSRTPSGTRTTPTDDGRWPSINSKPAPLMARSLKGLDVPKQKVTPSDAKTIEKYATLPRRKKDKFPESHKDANKATSRESTQNRIALVKRSLSSKEPIPSRTTNSLHLPNCRTKHRTRIYHETSSQTALTMNDVEDAFSGLAVAPKGPTDVEKCSESVQVDIETRERERLEERLRELTEKFSSLQKAHEEQTEKLKESEMKLKRETSEKNSLMEELEHNSQRVLAILGNDDSEKLGDTSSNDSLMVLETRFQNVGQVIVKQEEEISKLNNLCRSLQAELEKSVAGQQFLMQQQHELETESVELQEFMQAEKMTLQEALKESESELARHQTTIKKLENEVREKLEENKQLVKTSEQLKQENISIQARLSVLETKSRELLVQQGSSVSGAAVALSALIGRLDGLVEELVMAYSISDQELDDVIFHNEAYKHSSSSPDSTPEKSRKIFIEKLPSPQKGSSFVSAVINAIKNAAHTPFALRDISKDNLSMDKSSSNEMLDSETEPCLMMEHVLEDVVIPDGHSQNLISSGHGSLMSSRLTQSESLKDLSQAIFNRQSSWSCCDSLNTSFIGNSFYESFSTLSLVDQVIDVDNLVTRLLKVIRIIHMENEDCMNELQEQRDSLLEQIEKQKETNRMVVVQLKDWEMLGARLKGEVKELLSQLSKKAMEIDGLKSELNKQREEVEKLNQDVCELSTALAKAELESRTKEEEVNEEIKKWEKTGEVPAAEVLARLVTNQNEFISLKEKLSEKEKRLTELSQEYSANRQVLTENLKDALNESKKQYEAIDCALEVLHSIQSVVQQCPPLSKLQRDLEEMNFQSASSVSLVIPSDCNANAGLLQTVNVKPTINSTL